MKTELADYLNAETEKLKAEQKKENMNDIKTAADGVKIKLMTIKELSESLGVDYIKASGLVAVLVEQGAIKCVGSKSMNGAMGKPAKIYEFPEVIELLFWQSEVVTMPEIVETQEVTEIIPAETVSIVS